MMMVGYHHLKTIDKDTLLKIKIEINAKVSIDEKDIRDEKNSQQLHHLSTLDNLHDPLHSVMCILIDELINEEIKEQTHDDVMIINPLVESNSSLLYQSSTKHADETLDILRKQVKTLGDIPLEYLSLEEIQLELGGLMELVNADKPYNEARLDYLLRCMQHNPEYQKQKEEAANRWRETLTPFMEESLEAMRGYVPPFIFNITEQSLVDEYGMDRLLAKRIFTKKCLWLVRMHSQDIEKLHEAELLGRFNPEAQNLDIVELAAVYAALPSSFLKDPFEKKQKWKLNIEEKLKEMFIAKEAGKLSKQKLRNDSYRRQTSLFSDRHSLHTMDTAGSNDIVSRISFRNIGRLNQNNTIGNMLPRNRNSDVDNHTSTSSIIHASIEEMNINPIKEDGDENV
jgi:hypothetical protein